ncbi:hypothetical protein GCM10023081_39950 [Arthrobacter ginkgonis]|uniref:Integrase catalytic domain-containing protein n=1 Tax=Arthrobacter ginkgonis TaxID=1630594 RepID=A0ABP7D0P1_9MICC
MIRRYEHPYPGSLLHVDVTKFGNIPDGGGHRYAGRHAGSRNSRATANRTGQRTPSRHPRPGTAFVHTVVDDHSRIAYAEIHDDEKAVTAIGVLERAVAWFTARGVTTERVLTDNGSANKSRAWREACTALTKTVIETALDEEMTGHLGYKSMTARPSRPRTCATKPGPIPY